MREKRLRRQEMEEQASSSSQDKADSEAVPSQKPTGSTLKRKVPARVTLTPPGSSSPSSTTVVPDSTPSTQKVPVRKQIPFKSKTASPLNSTAAVPVQQGESQSCSQSPSSSREVPERNTVSSTAPSAARPTRAAPQGPNAEKILNTNRKKSPEHSADTKGTSLFTLHTCSSSMCLVSSLQSPDECLVNDSYSFPLSEYRF